MSKRKILTLALSICMIAILAVGGTLAYFTDTTDTKENVFTVGGVEIELTEPNWDAEGSEDAPEVYPGEALAKDPTVTNIGANPCFVRVSVEGLDCLGDAGDIIYRTAYVDGALGTDWFDGGDGFFYYRKPLLTKEATTALFDQIVIPTGVTNEDATGEYSVDVYAQAVQAQGAKASWSAVQNMTDAEIVAWFGTCMAEAA